KSSKRLGVCIFDQSHNRIKALFLLPKRRLWRIGVRRWCGAPLFRDNNVALSLFALANSSIDHLAEVGERNGLVDTGQGCEITLEFLDLFEHLPTRHAAFFTTAHDNRKGLRAANFFTDDFIRDTHWRIRLEKLEKIRICPDAAHTPQTRND